MLQNITQTHEFPLIQQNQPNLTLIPFNKTKAQAHNQKRTQTCEEGRNKKEQKKKKFLGFFFYPENSKLKNQI